MISAINTNTGEKFVGYFKKINTKVPNWELKQSWTEIVPGRKSLHLNVAKENYLIFTELYLGENGLEVFSYIYRRNLATSITTKPFVYLYEVEDIIKESDLDDIWVTNCYEMNDLGQSLCLQIQGEKGIEYFILDIESKKIYKSY